MPAVSSARTFAPESVCIKADAVQRQDPVVWDAAERHCLQALDAAVKAQRDRRPARLYEVRHKYAEAEKYYRSAYNIAKTLFAAQSDEVAKALNHLGKMQVQQGRISETDGTFHC